MTLFIKRPDRMKKCVLQLIALLALCAFGAQAQAQGILTLGPDDIIEITVSNHPEINQIITIRPDGKITLPRAGDVQAAGRTSQALAADIQKRLSRTLNNARVTIAVKEVHSRNVRVTGAVNKSGSYELKTGWRFMDLVAEAGGLATKSTRITGRIVRGGKVIPLNVEMATLKPESKSNPLLKPSDLIVLDQRDIFKQINVIGKVAKPGSYDLTEDLSIISLLNDAGGPTAEAALKKAYVQRAGAQIALNLHELLLDGKTNAMAARFRFRAGDVLVIPENQERFSVMGEVAKPGFYSLPEKKGQVTALKALAEAGNSVVGADLRNATITRLVKGQQTSIPIDLESRTKGETADDVALQSGDLLYIPKTPPPPTPPVRQMHVIGRVAKPGAYNIVDDLTVVSLMAEVGNAQEGAGLSKAYVLRGSEQISLNLYKVLVMGQKDETVTNFRFQNNDVLVVPDVQDQISVIGKVVRPGSFNLDDDLTAISLITKAGGATEDAALRKTYVLRRNIQIPLNLYPTLSEGKSDSDVNNFKFEPGDVLMVPENQVRYAVMGSVARQGYYAIPEKKGEASVIKALNAAGGSTGGNLKEAGILRNINGVATVIPVNIEEILRKGNLAKNIQLQPEDVLYIPPKGQSRSILQSIAQTLPFFGLF